MNANDSVISIEWVSHYNSNQIVGLWHSLKLHKPLNYKYFIATYVIYRYNSLIRISEIKVSKGEYK